MYSEVGFIFNPSLESSLTNRNNTGDIYGRVKQIQPRKNSTSSTIVDKNANDAKFKVTPDTNPAEKPPLQDAVLVFKGPTVFGTSQIINYIKTELNPFDDSNEDPYISLINYFNDKKSKALRLKAADFAYLKDLGVYPINRLWILRRFPDNAIVPNNLMTWGKAVEPISTVIGWFKYKEDDNILSLNFGENWIDQTNMIDKLIGEILRDQFGITGADKIVSVPGWSQGILFGMLNAMGLTSDYNAENVPTGDPNVLRVSKMRDINSQSLNSDINLTLETSYEQKYINGIDPGMAMLDILSNLFKMGTSEMHFVLGNSPALQSFIGATNAPSDKGRDAWLAFIKAIVNSFIQGVTGFIDEMSAAGTPTNTSDNSKKTDDNQKSNSQLGLAKLAEKSSVSGIGNIVKGIATALLAGTIYKYRWPLKGSIALMSGINTTPWHLTVGNPYSPIINMGNAWVSNVDIKLSNDMGFNDMPVRVDATIQCKMGRPLGRSELERLFNNGYKRVYAKPTGGDGSAMPGEDQINPITPDGSSASNKVSGLYGGAGSGPDQPDGTLSRINNSVNPYLDNTGQPKPFGGYGGGQFGGGGAGGEF